MWAQNAVGGGGGGGGWREIFDILILYCIRKRQALTPCAFLSERDRQTDRQTDGRMDIQPDRLLTF